MQVGDPFTEKCLLEACLELMKTGAVIAIQDMGAAGLTCSAVEMGAKGDLGVELDLDKVPVREERMSAYEMMLSESSRAHADGSASRKAKKPLKPIFRQMGVWTFADRRNRPPTICASAFYHNGEEVANLPIKELGDEAPEYDRPWVETPKLAKVDSCIRLKRAMFRRPDIADSLAVRWLPSA